MKEKDHTRFTAVIILKDTMDGNLLVTHVHLPSTKPLSDEDIKKCIEFSPALQACGIAMDLFQKINEENQQRKQPPKAKAV